jgi:multimeric flavodoxin WrbA
MKITIMNASPKEENSASQQLIDRLIPFLKGNEYGVLQVRQGMDEDLALKAAELSDAWIIVAPMYLSSLPSSMIALMDVLGSEDPARRASK